MPHSPLVHRIIETDTLNAVDIFSTRGRIFTFVNPVSYLTALDNRELFERFDGLFADGSLLVAAIRLLYGKKVTRCSFDMTSVAPKLFDYANKNNCSICVVATRQEIMEQSVSKLANRYPNIMWSGCRNGYFANEEEMQEAAKKIAQDNPDFLLVGMGTGMQEIFLLMCKEAGYRGIGFTCGGFIHQTAMQEDGTNYYPRWADRLNLRFLYRIYMEPHTRKRYLQAAFLFPPRFLWERLTAKK